MAHENGSMKYDIDISKQDQSTSHGKILAQIKPGSKVLECGCATGYMTQRMKEELGCKVSIIEIDEACYECAKEFAVDGFCGDLNQEEWFEHFSNQQFDYILFADVLEHLPDPLKVLTRMTDLLKSNGRIIISIPNIAHNDIIMKLVGDRFDYTSTGLLDNTHIHFWGRNNLDDFCQKAGLTIVQIDGTIAPFKTTEQAADNHETSDSRIISGLTDRTLGEIYQYVLVTQKTEYVKKHRIKCVNLLPQEKSFSGYQTGKDVSVCSTVFFSDGETFEQSNSQETVFTLNTAFSREIELIVTPPENCRTIRFDPCEAFFCLVENLSFVYDGMAISPQNTNGLPVGTAYLFSTRDPQLYFSIPRLKKDTSIVIRCKLTIFDETKEKEVAEFVKRFEDMGVLIHQVEQLNNELNIAQSELKLAQETKKELACCTVYFADEAGFHEENKATFSQPISRDDNSTFSLNFDVKVPIGCTKVRIDPCEGKYCVASSIRLIYAGRRLTGSPADGFVVGDTVFFRNEDPQLIVDLPDGNGMVLHADMTMRLFDVRDLTIESVDQRIREDSEKISTLSEDISKLKETHVREIAAMQESQEAKLEELEQSHAQEIAALQESQQTKLSELEQGHAQEITILQNQLSDAEKKIEISETQNLDKWNNIIEITDICNNRQQQIETLTAQINSLQSDIQQVSARCAYAEQSYEIVANAFFWKITKPARAVMDGIKRLSGKNQRIYQGLRFIKWTLRYGPIEAVKREKRFDVATPQAFPTAIIPAVENREKAPVQAEIKISILVPLNNTSEQYLREMIESVLSQTYTNWQLCLTDTSDQRHEYVESICKQYACDDGRICYKKLKMNMSTESANVAAKMADGEYIGLLNQDDLLSPDALERNVIAIHENQPDILYSDEDRLLEDRQHGDFYFKPDWSPDFLNSQMYICHFLVFKRSLFWEVNGFKKEYGEMQDYDLALRLSENKRKIIHIREILYTCRDTSSTGEGADTKLHAQNLGLKAVNEHLHRIYGTQANAKKTEHPFVYDARYPLPEDTKITIVIPMKDKWKLTDACVKSIVEKSTWKNYEILILDNRSTDHKTFKWFKTIKQLYPAIRILKADMEFNWSKINNFGIQNGKGDVFIFLNNDTIIISPDWMERLAEKAIREDTGVVGPLLLYEDGTIQHAGVVVGIGGWADHVFKGLEPIHKEYPFVSPMVMRNVLAVTGACLAVSRKTLEKIGNFDETFIICGSDVELGIRANDFGLFNVYDPFVRLYHLESKSRDSYIPEQDYKRSWEVYTPYREGVDPYFNPHLDKNSSTPKMIVQTIKPDEPQSLETEAAAHDETMEGGKGEDMNTLVRVKEALKSNPLTRGVYSATREKIRTVIENAVPPPSNIGEVQPAYARKEDNSHCRLNLLVPTVDKKYVFGGIATAIKVFERLCDETGWNGRVITVDGSYSEESSVISSRYKNIHCSAESEEPFQVVAFNDRSAATLPVRKYDIFVATAWWTAYIIQDVIKWQKEVWNLNTENPLIYLIQDYEPNFYPWSSRYLMAESTYRMNIPVYALFNSKFLKEYFDLHQYSFIKSWYFDPELNDKLKEYLPKDLTAVKKKQILVYGRPGVPRNAFELLCMSLREFIALSPENKEWVILSAGEEHCDIDLGSGATLRSIGKLSLEKYANLLLETYAGISLMVSPHPSYPPLEMATFGVKTITNCYANKDLSLFSDCIVSIKEYTAKEIATQLNKICSQYTSKVTWNINKEYAMNGGSYDGVIKLMASELNNIQL